MAGQGVDGPDFRQSRRQGRGTTPPAPWLAGVVPADGSKREAYSLVRRSVRERGGGVVAPDFLGCFESGLVVLASNWRPLEGGQHPRGSGRGGKEGEKEGTGCCRCPQDPSWPGPPESAHAHQRKVTRPWPPCKGREPSVHSPGPPVSVGRAFRPDHR